MSEGNENTTVRQCTCESEFQDDRYGKGKRVHNKCQGKNKHLGHYRCTVCGKTG